MNKNILYLSYDGMTDPLGQSQVIPYLQGLSKKGYQFTLISFEKPLLYQAKGKKIQSILDHSGIRWVPLKYHKSPPVLSTLLDLWLMKVKANRLHRQHTFAIIHCRSYLSALIGLSMKKKHGTEFLFDMRGFWADERVEGGIWNLGNPIYKLIYHFFKRKEKAFFEQADCTISLTENAKKEIHTWQHISANPIPIQVIPCCADLDHFDRNSIKTYDLVALRKKLNLGNDDFVLVYLGSLGSWYRLEEMLRFFKVLLEKEPKAKFMILTKDQHILIQPLLDQLRIPSDKVILRSVDREEVPIYLKLANLAVFFYQTSFSKRATSPTKQGELMSMGIPIICNTGVGDTAEIIQQTGAGAIVADLAEVNYREVCEQLDNLLLINSEAIRSGAKQYYSLEKGVEAYSQVYEKLL